MLRRFISFFLLIFCFTFSQVLSAQGAIDLTATGYAASSNADGSKSTGRDGTITFAAVKNSSYTNVANSNNSLAWQSQSGVLSVLSASSFVAFDLKFFTVFFALCTGILSLIYQYQEFFSY